jgi:type II secretory pathway pseudopilin PulG
MAEVLVAIAVVSVVMLSLSSFFVISTRIDSEQGDRQSAIQAADDAMERARGLQPDALLAGRDLTSSTQQWSAPIASVANLLVPAAQTMAYDSSALPGAGPDAVLPTTYRSLVLNGIVFRQYWYIGSCQRPSTGGACVAASPTSVLTTFYRIIVGVTWPGRSCPGSICAYVSSSLIGSQTDDPVFDTNDGAPPPSITSTPGSQTGDVSLPAGLALTSSGGTAPLTWSGTSLPAGLSIDPSSGTISGTPVTAAASGVTVTVTDAYGQKATSGFSWTINAALGYAGFTPPASTAGTAISPSTLTATNGTKAYAWTATGLPAGVAIDGPTGVLSGTPRTKGAYPVTTTVTDAKGASVTRSTTWTVS